MIIISLKIDLCYLSYVQRSIVNCLRNSILLYFSVFTYWINKDNCNIQRFQFSPKPIAVAVKTLPSYKSGDQNTCELRSMDADQDRITPCLTDRNSEGVEDFSHAKISRPKVPTEKMKEYRFQLIKRDIETAQRAC